MGGQQTSAKSFKQTSWGHEGIKTAVVMESMQGDHVSVSFIQFRHQNLRALHYEPATARSYSTVCV